MEQTLLGEGRKKICHGRGIPIQNIRKHSQRTYDPYPFGKSRPARIISPKKKREKCSIFLTLSWTCRKNN
jgi:hypothetical protein